MKILGIGNAIVDVICKVEDEFITENNLTKSTMKLVDEAEFKKILSTLKIEETVSGGSVANSIVGLSQLGNKVGFIGKVSDDDLGQKYENVHLQPTPLKGGRRGSSRESSKLFLAARVDGGGERTSGGGNGGRSLASAAIIGNAAIISNATIDGEGEPLVGKP